ncbi:MAG: hypothetical protein NWQ09_11935, partial [Nonlabens sp.]|nr:hypothetical protein [Nonlabens sp.]
MKKIVLLISLLTIFNACTETYKEVEFKEIKNVRLTNVSGTSVDLNGDCLLYNPNDVALDITDA